VQQSEKLLYKINSTLDQREVDVLRLKQKITEYERTAVENEKIKSKYSDLVEHIDSKQKYWDELMKQLEEKTESLELENKQLFVRKEHLEELTQENKKLYADNQVLYKNIQAKNELLDELETQTEELNNSRDIFKNKLNIADKNISN